VEDSLPQMGINFPPLIIYTYGTHVYYMKKGSHHSEETKRIMREKANRDPRPPEVIQRIKESKLNGYHPYRGKKLSPEHRKNISDGMKRRKEKNEQEHSDEIC